MDPSLPIVPVASRDRCQHERIVEDSESTSEEAAASILPPRSRARLHQERTIIMEDTGEHNLLRERDYRFSVFTLQRAFIAWTALGRQYDFNDVCKYYHVLEQHEATLPKPNQDQSRNLEYSHIHSCGAAADFLHYYFPREVDPVKIKVVMIPPHPSNANDPLLPASLLITSYLRETGRDISEMLYAFKSHAMLEGIPTTLYNLVQYVRCLTIQHRKNKKTSSVGESIDEILNGPFTRVTRRAVAPMAVMYMRMKAINEEFLRRYRRSLPTLPSKPDPQQVQALMRQQPMFKALTSSDKQVDDDAAGGDRYDRQTLALKKILDIQ